MDANKLSPQSPLPHIHLPPGSPRTSWINSTWGSYSISADITAIINPSARPFVSPFINKPRQLVCIGRHNQKCIWERNAEWISMSFPNENWRFDWLNKYVGSVPITVKPFPTPSYWMPKSWCQHRHIRPDTDISVTQVDAPPLQGSDAADIYRAAFSVWLRWKVTGVPVEPLLRVTTEAVEGRLTRIFQEFLVVFPVYYWELVKSSHERISAGCIPLEVNSSR